MWLGCQVTERPSKKLLQETPAQAVIFLFVCLFVFQSSFWFFCPVLVLNYSIVVWYVLHLDLKASFTVNHVPFYRWSCCPEYQKLSIDNNCQQQ